MHEINVQNEKEFHNKIFEEKSRDELLDYYSFTNYIYTSFYNQIRNSVSADSYVLEYGCGLNSYINDLAANSKNKYAFDISDYAIKVNQQTYPDTNYSVADAHSLHYPDNYFDLVFGSSILHHLELNKALSEINRITKPGGTIIFLEPLGHNYFINRFRAKTPEHRTPDEHPFLQSDIDMVKKYFSLSDTKFFCLTPLVFFAIFRRKTPAFLFTLARKIDSLLFGIFPFLKKYSWIVILNGKKLK